MFEQNAVLMSATKRAFDVPYQDKGVLANLLEKMEDCRSRWSEKEKCEKSDRLYSPYIPIVQASMMGKTRMFFALPQANVFVFYICLREAKSSGYPSSIPELTTALTGPCSEGFYSAFLLAALDALNRFKGTFRGCNISVFEAWFSHQQRSEFWAEIIGLENALSAFLV